MVVKVKVKQRTFSLFMKSIRVTPRTTSSTEPYYSPVKNFPDIFDDPGPSTNTYN